MERILCPRCLELLSEALECMFCGGHYDWVEREENSEMSSSKKEERK